jgi:hypothetical protein
LNSNVLLFALPSPPLSALLIAPLRAGCFTSKDGNTFAPSALCRSPLIRARILIFPRYEGLWENDAKCGYGLFSYLKGNHRSVSGSWIDDVSAASSSRDTHHCKFLSENSVISYCCLRLAHVSQVLSGWACVTCRNGDTIDGVLFAPYF